MTHIQQRRDDSAVWTSEDPVLFEGEAGHETDTGKWKMGDGVTAWTALPYKNGVDSIDGEVGVVTGFAKLASPAFTGNPTAPTPSAADNDTSIATTAFVQAQKASPVFTGNPTAPTPATSDDDTSIATTEYVQNQIGSGTRLDPVATPTVVDYDTLTSSGWYSLASGSANSPDGAVSHYLEVRAYNATYVEQTARATTAGDQYRRTMVAGVWGAWISMGTPFPESDAGFIGAPNVTSTEGRVYRRDGQATLHIEFTTTAAISAGTTLFTVPSGYRPPKRIFPLVMGAGVIYLVQINTAGVAALAGGALSSGVQHLGSVSYRHVL